MRFCAGSRMHLCTCPKKYTYTHNNVYTHIYAKVSVTTPYHLRTAALSARPLLRSEEAGHKPGKLCSEAGLISKGGTPGSLPAERDSDGVYGLRLLLLEFRVVRVRTCWDSKLVGLDWD